MTDTLHPVAAAYREVMRQGGNDLPAYRAALEVYRQENPDVDDDTARKETARIIAEASRFQQDLFWDRVGTRRES